MSFIFSQTAVILDINLDTVDYRGLEPRSFRNRVAYVKLVTVNTADLVKRPESFAQKGRHNNHAVKLLGNQNLRLQLHCLKCVMNIGSNDIYLVYFKLVEQSEAAD